MLVHQKNIIIS